MSIGVGEALTEARISAGIRLADAAAETRIRESHLLALEEEDFGRLGGDVYVKGFLRSYARHLGIDPEPLIATYRRHYQGGEEAARVASQPIESPPVARRPIATIVVVLVVLVLGGLFVIGVLVPDDEGSEDGLAAPDPVEEELESEEPDDGDEEGGTETQGVADGGGDEEDAREGDGSDEGVSEDDGAPEPTEDELTLTFAVPSGVTWARIIVDGEHVAEGEYQGGHSETYTGEEIVVRIGAPQNASLELNGEDVGQLGSGSPVDVTCTTSAGDCVIG